MHKLIMHGRIMLIGLSMGLYLSGCILFNIDPPNKNYIEKYRNSSNKEITIVMKKMTSTEVIEISTISQGKESSLHIDSYFNGGDTPINGYVDDLVRGEIKKIELYVEGLLVKEWVEPPGFFGDSINSPFNYDSWVFEALKPDDRNVVGKITFTITDDDLN